MCIKLSMYLLPHIQGIPECYYYFTVIILKLRILPVTCTVYTYTLPNLTLGENAENGHYHIARIYCESFNYVNFAISNALAKIKLA